jgi:hypothetical protein
MTDFDELLDLERSGWIALCEGAGADFYGSTMTEDGRMVLANGVALDRQGVIDSLVDAPPWAGYELADVHLIAMSGGVLALVYSARAWRDDPQRPFRALMSSTYLRSDEGWRLALYQQTPIPDQS